MHRRQVSLHIIFRCWHVFGGVGVGVGVKWWTESIIVVLSLIKDDYIVCFWLFKYCIVWGGGLFVCWGDVINSGILVLSIVVYYGFYKVYFNTLTTLFKIQRKSNQIGGYRSTSNEIWAFNRSFHNWRWQKHTVYIVLFECILYRV